nr:MAG TPA: hypothetical protein [Caudoviricetes sp.]
MTIDKLSRRESAPMFTYMFNSSESHTGVSINMNKIWVNTSIHENHQPFIKNDQ